MRGTIKENLTNFLSRGSAARFACHEYRYGVFHEGGGEPLDLRALATAIQTFKCNQLASAKGHGKILASEYVAVMTV